MTTITPLELEEVLIVEPRVFGDPRGYFFETYSPSALGDHLGGRTFVQDNLSFSRRGILRGLHLQHPHAQGKLVMVITGAIFDVAVDVRPDSPTRGRWVGAELSEGNHKQIWVPPGFAHGFCVLSETAHVLYKCTEVYHPETELSIHYADPDLGIAWPIDEPLVSEKDQRGLFLKNVPRDRLPLRGGPA